MPGKVLAREEGARMGVYKLTFPGDQRSAASPFRPRNMGRAARVQPVAGGGRLSVDTPELERFSALTTGTISEDDATSIFTSSTRTSNTISDDDISLADFAVRTSDFAPARHSTACCTDLALRRELRKKFQVEQPALDEAPATTAFGQSDRFAFGQSFRKELEEDRVESLALWEETVEVKPVSNSRTITKDMPHSWHGDTASSMSSRNKAMEAIFHKPRKSGFLNGFFSGLANFSTSRRSRKS